jgi:hypothetical protein
MSSKHLSTKSLLELLDLFERSRQPLADVDGQVLRGVPGWDLSRITSMPPKARDAWLERVGYAGSFPAPCRDEHVPVELEEDDDPSRYRYRCPETFRLKFLETAEAAVYAVRPTAFLGVVADLLDIPKALRKGIDSPSIDGVLWNLGKARVGPAHTDVWFARGLAQSVEDVFRHFHSPTIPDQGLILTSGQPLPEFVRPPRNYRFAAVRQVLVDYVTTPTVDMDLLHRTLATPADGTLRPVLPVHFDEYTHTLTIRSKSNRPWVIKGERQAAAVRYMYEQAVNDRWLLSAGEILAAAYSDKKAARSQRMQNLFSGNIHWEDYIDNPEKGKYRFRLD